MGEPVIFDAATFAFFYGMILIYTAILGVPLALGIHWLLQKLRLSNALVYVGVGATISLLLVALTRPYGLGTFFRHGGDGIANSIIVIGVSASALFWWIAVRPHRLAGTGV